MPPLRREMRMALIEAKNIKMYFPVQRRNASASHDWSWYGLTAPTIDIG